MRQAAAVVVSLVIASAVPAAGATSRPRPRGGPVPHDARGARLFAMDAWRRIDVNRINLLVANDGSLPYTPSPDGGGMVYPKGSGQTALFTAGLRLGGRVGGETRVTEINYASEYGPGAMVGGAADDPSRPEYQVFKVARWTGRSADSAHVERSDAERAADPDLDSLAHHSWSEYMAGAARRGAPWRMYRLPVTATADPTDSVDVPGPDVLGDQMLWSVFNDADPGLHTVYGGKTAPLGIEVRETLFAYDRPGPLGSTVFLRYDLHNRGTNTITEMHTTMWGDFDIGGATDDLAGCMESRSLGFMYNNTNADAVYGAGTPALGFDLLKGMDSFVRYVDDSTEPSTAEESFRAMQGLANDGSPIVDPTTAQMTKFMVTGDPVAGTGWLDELATDRRIHCNAGPATLAPGDSLTLWVALVIGQADTPIGSVAALRCADDYVQSVFNSGFAEPFLAPPACEVPPANCPRGLDWWGAHCTDGTGFTPAQWDAIAHRVDSLSVVFDFPSIPRTAYCATLAGPWPTARDSAKAEYLALLSNVATGDLGLIPADGERARLERATRVVIPPLVPNLVGQVIQDGYPPTGSAERLFQWLEPLSLSDTSVVNQYRAFTAGAADVNHGLGIGAVCSDPAQVAGTLIEARTEGHRVTLRWQLAMPVVAARLEVRNEWGVWLDYGPAEIEGSEATARDFWCFACQEGTRTWYRLAVAAPIGLARTDSVSLGTPTYPSPLGLVAVWPNPSQDGRPHVEFTLPTAGTVSLDVFDLNGRRVSEREVPGLGLGTQYLEIAPETKLRAGVYFVRLRFGEEHRTARLVVLN